MNEPTLGQLLLVDDEVELRNTLAELLSAQNYQVTAVANGAEALAALESQPFDLLLTDLMMPGIDGIQLLKKALEYDPNLMVIIMTGQGTIQTAVEAMKLGAFDYVLKPFKLSTMLPNLARAMEVRRLRTENVRLRQYVAQLTYESPRYQLIGSGPAMRKVVLMIEKVTGLAAFAACASPAARQPSPAMT